MASPLLRMRGICKSFDGHVALQDADFELARNEVHALLGGNGAGKTTLMNVLFGLYRADAGEIELDGRPLRIKSPRDAIAHSIGMVHQNFIQIPEYSVYENIVLGEGRMSLRSAMQQSSYTQIGELAKRFGLEVDPRARLKTLPMGARQRVEILKALYRDATILILDEPTTNLVPHEVDSLFRSLREMAGNGISIVIITHKINDAKRVADRVTVLRQGRTVETFPQDRHSARDIVSLMIDAPESDASDSDPLSALLTGARSATGGATVEHHEIASTPRLEVRGLALRGSQGLIDMTVRRGEILGIAGVAGNGQGELAEVLAGIRRPASGNAFLDGEPLTGGAVRRSLAAGVAYVPEDSRGDAILPNMSIPENLLLGRQREKALSRLGTVRWRSVRRASAALVSEYGISERRTDVGAGTLSGGNIQRVVLARAFARNPQLLILHNPTRGLDIESVAFIYQKVQAHAALGTSVILLSEDMDELFYLADRIHVIYSCDLVGEWSPLQYDAREIGRWMTGVGDGVDGHVTDS